MVNHFGHVKEKLLGNNQKKCAFPPTIPLTLFSRAPSQRNAKHDVFFAYTLFLDANFEPPINQHEPQSWTFIKGLIAHSHTVNADKGQRVCPLKFKPNPAP